MSTFAIGDIHGQTGALRALLAAVPLTENDCLVFLGDYVDKGPDVSGTLDLLCSLSKGTNRVFLRGNHDQMLIDAHLDPSKFGVWECLAGESPLSSYGAGNSEELLEKIPGHHWRFLEDTCVNYHESGEFIYVHAGIRPDRDPAEEEVERLQWMALSMALPHQSGKTIVCGHTRNELGNIVDLGHTICIDTGISKGGWLTCLDTDGFRFWQASADGVIREGRIR